MKPSLDGAYPQRILLAILAPVLIVGLIASIVAGSLITPPILQAIQKRIDAELDYAASMALQICDSHLNYLLEHRLEDDREMDSALQKEAAAQIIDLVDRVADIHLLIADGDGRVRQVSNQGIEEGQALSLDKRATGITRDLVFGSDPVRAHYFYFPLWDWYVVGFIHERDYQAPLMLARKAIYGGALAVLIATWLTLYVVVSRLISGPLRRLAAATSKVSQGDFSPLPHPRRDEIGQVVASFNAMVLDLEWKNREVAQLIAALRESEKRYRELFDGAAEGILVAEAASGRLRYANATICRMLGYGEAALTSLGIDDIHRRQDLQLIGAGDVHGRGRQTPSSIAEIPCIRSDGSIIYVDIKATPVTVDGIACELRFYTDVTGRRAAVEERRDLESRLHRSEKMEAIGLLAGGVAHDLNNILSGLVSYPELILMDLPED
ncbi:MAG: HAMP domain-containing protein, partial [Desulfofustis sp.]|nr:HAMP domain-containing protein [Desulfofustis sp.]